MINAVSLHPILSVAKLARSVFRSFDYGMKDKRRLASIAFDNALSLAKKKLVKKTFLCFVFLLGGFSSPAEDRNFELVIYGGTSSAITAAVQAKRMGKTVAIVSPASRLGGLTGCEAGGADPMKNELTGGLAREFHHRVWRHYQSPDAWKWQKMEDFGNRGQGSPASDGDQRTMWIFEPRVAREIFESWILENELSVFGNEWLDREGGVEMDGAEIRAINTLAGNRYEGLVFMDCTEEGDLMAAAGVSFQAPGQAQDRYGRNQGAAKEGASQILSSVNLLDAFLPGDDGSKARSNESSNPLKTILGPAEAMKTASHFRLCLTQVEENRVPFPMPPEYDSTRYEFLLDPLQRGEKPIFGTLDSIPNAKTIDVCLGLDGLAGDDLIARYLNGSYDLRSKLISQQGNHLKGFCYFMSNDSRLSDEARNQAGSWGLAADEFTENENWPEHMYLTKSRRMVGASSLTEKALLERRKGFRAVGMALCDLSALKKQADESGLLVERDVDQVEPYEETLLKVPCAIPYECMLPLRRECKNLIVPICLSATRLALDAIRSEALFMLLGQSAATAAALSIERNCSLQELPYSLLRDRLVADGQILEIKREKRMSWGLGVSSSSLGGVVVDATMVELEGDWVESSSLRPFVGESYFHDGNGGKGLLSARFSFIAPSDGLHEVKASFSSFGNRAGNVRYEIENENGRERLLVDQRKPNPSGNLWRSLGSFLFKKGQRYAVSVFNENTEGYVVADAIQVISLNP